MFARKRRTELCLQVYLPSSKYDLQLDITCCNVSDWRQKEQLDDWEMAHLQKFLQMGRALLRYLIEKLEMFLIILKLIVLEIGTVTSLGPNSLDVKVRRRF